MDTITDYLKLIVKMEVEQAIRDADKWDKTVNGTVKTVGKLGDEVKKSTGFFNSMTGEIVKGISIQRTAEAGYRKLITVVTETSAAWREQQAVEENLAFAVSNSPYLDSSSLVNLQNFASGLQDLTIYGDETTLSFINMLIPLGRTEKQIQDIITTAADMDSRDVMSFESAVRNLNKSFGGTTGELAELFPELKTLTAEQLKAGEAVDILGEKFEGFAEGAAKTAKGEVEQYKNAVGDFKEEIGAGWETAISPARKALTEFLTDITDSMKKSREFYGFISDPTRELGTAKDYTKQLQGFGRGLIAENYSLLVDVKYNFPEEEQLSSAISILEQNFYKKQAELAAEGYEVTIATISEVFAQTEIKDKGMNALLKEANQYIFERAAEEHKINTEKARQGEENRKLLLQEEDLAKKAAAAAAERSKAYKEWREALYGQTESSQLESLEKNLARADVNFSFSIPGTEDFEQLSAIIPHLTEQILALRQAEKSQGQEIIESLQEQIALYGKSEEEILRYKMATEGATDAEIAQAVALQETYNQLTALDESYESARGGVVSFSDYLNEEFYNALMKVNGMAKETAIIIADLMTQFTDGSISIAVDGFSDLGAALEDGKLSAKEFGSIMAKQAKAILDMLPMLFVQAGLNLIANGQIPLGLGFVLGGISSSIISGFTDAVTESSAKGNVISGGEIVHFAKGGVANTAQYSAMPSGKTAEWAEAGWEAYVPLTRTPSGELGVNATGVGGSNVNIVINNYSGEEVTQTEKENGGSREIEITIGKLMKSQVEAGQLDGPMKRRYGVKAQGVK